MQLSLRMPDRSDSAMRLIAIFKLVKGGILLIAGIAALFLPHGLTDQLLRLQPGHGHVRDAVARVCALSPRTAELAGVACWSTRGCSSPRAWGSPGSRCGPST